MIVEILDIASKSETEVKSSLSLADIIYVCGGNTFYLLEHMDNCNFKEILLNHTKDKCLYIGSSAGSIVCSPDIEFIKPMDESEKANLTNYTGLNLVDFLFLPHLNHLEMGTDAITIMKEQKQQGKIVIALEDTQALYVNDNIVRVI